MIPNLQDIDSVAIFGSVARRDNDNLSDYDMLLVCEDRKSLIRGAYLLEKVGWSCTRYSWSQINRVAERQTLFLQHLKQEAIVIKDKHGRLTDFLNAFNPKVDYFDEAEEAMKLLSLLSVIPKSIAGRLWALDVLMVGFRSLAVATLANEGDYCFSLLSILRGLERLGILQSSDIAALLRLRRYKRYYRDQQWNQVIDWSEVYGLIDIIDQRFCIGLDVSCSPFWKVVDCAIATPSSLLKNWYIASRRAEAALLCLYLDPRSVDEEVIKQKLRLQERISIPSDYGWYFSHQYNEVKQHLMYFAEFAYLA